MYLRVKRDERKSLLNKQVNGKRAKESEVQRAAGGRQDGRPAALPPPNGAYFTPT